MNIYQYCKYMLAVNIVATLTQLKYTTLVHYGQYSDSVLLKLI